MRIALATDARQARGGVLHEDLREACLGAWAVPRHAAREAAQNFSWAQAVRLFPSHLVPARGMTAADKTSRAEVNSYVTRLSS